MENKKVKNATGCVYNGIHFKSKLEREAFKLFTQEGFNPEYEKTTFALQESELFPTPYYAPYRDRKLHKTVWGLNKYKIMGMKYTPDFEFNINHTTVYVEIKGFQNDRYPYQKKLFFNWLKKNNPNSVFFEIHNMRQLKSAVEIIKTLKENNGK